MIVWYRVLPIILIIAFNIAWVGSVLRIMGSSLLIIFLTMLGSFFIAGYACADCDCSLYSVRFWFQRKCWGCQDDTDQDDSQA